MRIGTRLSRKLWQSSSPLFNSNVCTLRRPWLVGILILLAATLAGGSSGARVGYLRSPDIHGDQIVFTAEGDLWIARLEDGIVLDVRRVTSHPGIESGARFSPDGTQLVFTGEYDGNQDVFVMDLPGGIARRLTWHPGGDQALGWTPDGGSILFRSSRYDPHWNSEIFRVPAGGGEIERLPLGWCFDLDIDSETGKWAFTRTYGGGTWKRYRGGTAPDIWVGDPDMADFRPVTSFDGMDAAPMWHGGRIYFLSDQGGTSNIWSILPDGSDRRRHTGHGEWDARMPGMGPDGRIVYMHAGGLRLFDPGDNSDRAIPIDLPSEQTLTRATYPDPAGRLTEYALSPDSERVLVVTRGEIFSVPVKKGVTLALTGGSGARERGIGLSPKGDRLAYITDESGEEAIVTADSWGRGGIVEIKPPQMTGYHFKPVWSPDGGWIAYADMTHTLYVAPAAGGERHRVDHDEHYEIRSYTWSPDGRWLAYAKNNEIGWGSIFIYNVGEKKTHQVTSWTTDDLDPVWDPDGRYLHFLSNRAVNPMFGSRDFESINIKPTRICMALLRPDVENPLQDRAGLPSSEGTDRKGKDTKGKGGKAAGDKDGKSGEKEGDSPPGPVEIDFAGLSSRIVELPVEPGNYYGLGATSDRIFYLSYPADGSNEESDDDDPGVRSTLMSYSFEDKESKPFLGGVASYHVQPGAGKVCVHKGGGSLFVIDAGAPPGEDLSDSAVDLGGIRIELDPRGEWRQMYFETWRNMRDFYWDDSMHGVDWEKIRDQYATLLPMITTRGDLRDVLAEMIGELSTSHTYVWGGEPDRVVPRRPTGLLGALVSREGAWFRVERIFRGDPNDKAASPLLQPGVNVKEGDYILAVNQRPFLPDRPFEGHFENMADVPVLLTVNSRPSMEGSRQEVVKPLRSDTELIYADWVRRNREYIAEKTNGRIGYIHVPDMGIRGLVEFDRWFYPQLAQEGMIVDIRWNGGGFVSQLLLARFQRKILSWDRMRWGSVSTYPNRVLNGPFVVLTNEFAGSDGDIFPYAVQLAGLAPVIGVRSWGGVIGIRGGRPLVDGGTITNPEFAWWDRTAGWGLEGKGVVPDIEVQNLPQELGRGIDSQLERGIEEVLRLHRTNPPERPEFGPAPDKSRRAFESELN